MIKFGLSPDTILVISLAFLLAGLVKGVVGGGLPAVAVPIMANVIAPAVAAAVTLVPVIVTNFWLLLQGGRFKEVLHRYWTFLLPLAIGSLIGAQILVTVPPATMALVIGGFVIILSPLPFIPKSWAIPEHTQKWLNPIAAGIMGIVGGATVMLAPVIVYFVALRIDKDLFAASMGAVALSSMAPLFLSLALNKFIGPDELMISIAVLIPALIGMRAGTWLRDHISQSGFQRVLFAALLGIGLNLVFKSLS